MRFDFLICKRCLINIIRDNENSINKNVFFFNENARGIFGGW